MYSKNDVKSIVEHAGRLGVRVIPEFDNPGHVRSIGLDPTYREAIRCFSKDWTYSLSGAYRIRGGPPTGAFDPSYPVVYDILSSILSEYNTDFPDGMVHLGGDEVLTSCYNENPDL